MYFLFYVDQKGIKSWHNYEFTFKKCIYLQGISKGKYYPSYNSFIKCSPACKLESFKSRLHFSILYIMLIDRKLKRNPVRNKKQRQMVNNVRDCQINWKTVEIWKKQQQLTEDWNCNSDMWYIKKAYCQP